MGLYIDQPFVCLSAWSFGHKQSSSVWQRPDAMARTNLVRSLSISFTGPVASQTFHHRQTLVRAGKHLPFSDFDFGDNACGLALL